MADEDRGWLESLKHYVSAPRRAFESLQRPPSDPNSPIEYTTASPLVNISRADIDKATEAAMAVSGGGLSTKPIRAYHSSPHDFDKFDLAKIGTGEGAQVYGHGLYFAENPAVSGQGGQYWQQFLPRFKGAEKEAANLLRSNKFDRDAAIKFSANKQEYIQKALDTGVYPAPAKYGTSRAYYEGLLRDEKARRDLLTSGQPVGPRTYEVNINADPAHFLDWDKALTEQHPQVRDALRSNYEKQWGFQNIAPYTTGEKLYQGAAGRQKTRTEGYPRSSEALLEAGIPGIRYLDQGSRNVQPILKTTPAGDIISSHYPPPTSNYVVFDPSILDIVKKYGLAGLASAPALTSGLRDRENPP